MNLRGLEKHLQIAASLAMLTAVALVAVVALVNSSSPEGSRWTADTLRKGSSLSALGGVEFSGSRLTLVLFLSAQCDYCSKSLPFYKQILELQKRRGEAVPVIGVFPDSAYDVQSYLQKNGLSMPILANVDFSKLKVPGTPAAALVDEAAAVVELWVGQQSARGEQEVLAALGLGDARLISDGSRRFRRTIEVFDERKPSLTIRPMVNSGNEVLRYVTVFDVDAAGFVYMYTNDSLLTYDSNGALSNSFKIPRDVSGPFCVDSQGQIYMPTPKGISIYAPSGELLKKVDLPDLAIANQVVLKIDFDRQYRALYLQLYDPASYAQSLHRIEADTFAVKLIHQLAKPVRFTPTYTPGAFDFAIGARYLCVSDVYEYKVYFYSLDTGAVLKTFAKETKPQMISDDDGTLINRKMTITKLIGPDTLTQYPPILHLSFTNAGNLLVWTSERDDSLRQVVHVFDDRMKLIGTDLQFTDPGHSNYRFINGKVYAPDLGFGRPDQLHRKLAPFDLPDKPFELKVFEESVHTVKPARPKGREGEDSQGLAHNREGPRLERHPITRNPQTKTSNRPGCS